MATMNRTKAKRKARRLVSKAASGTKKVVTRTLDAAGSRARKAGKNVKKAGRKIQRLGK
jgi:hypothetical protein